MPGRGVEYSMTPGFGEGGGGGGGLSSMFGGFGSFLQSNTGAIGGGLALGGIATSVISGFYQAKTAKLNAEVEAAWANLAADREQQRAVDVAKARGEEMFKMRLKQGQLEGTQRARIYAQGGGGDSAQRIMSDTKYISDLDARTAMSNTDKEVFAMRERARAKAFEGQAHRQRGRGIRPGLAALTAGFTGATQVASRWYERSDVALATTGSRG